MFLFICFFMIGLLVGWQIPEPFWVKPIIDNMMIFLKLIINLAISFIKQKIMGIK